MAGRMADTRGDKKGRNDAPLGHYVSPDSVRCIDCANARPVSWHSSLARCAVGEPPPLCGSFWLTDRRWCQRYRGKHEANKV